MTDSPLNSDHEPATVENGVRIPVTPASAQKPQRSAAEVDALIRQYEDRYGDLRDDESEAVLETVNGKFKPKEKPKRSLSARSVVTSDRERMWAALAHLSTLLTFFIGLPTGVGLIVTLLIPLMIYLYYRERSEYVAFHAMQSFALQMIGTIGAVVLLVAGVTVALVASFALLITLIGALLIPFVWLAFVLLAIVAMGMPIIMVVFGIIAAWESYTGKWYRLPFLGEWLERHFGEAFVQHV